MAGKHEEVMIAIKSALDGLALTDKVGDPLEVIIREKAQFDPRLDAENLPMFLVSKAEMPQDSIVFSATRVGILYPCQLTYIGASNRSQTPDLALSDEDKQSARKLFERMQPYAIVHNDFYKSEVRAAQPIDEKSWKEHFDVQVLIILVWLNYTP